MRVSDRWLMVAAALVMLVVVTSAPVTPAIQVGGLKVGGPDAACASSELMMDSQEIQCWDDEGNYIECPPEPTHPPGSGGGGGDDGGEDNCSWEKAGAYCHSCAIAVASGPWWAAIWPCAMCAYHSAKCL